MENTQEPKELNHKERAFVAEYLKNGYNATRAYIETHHGVTEETARARGCLWIAKNSIRAAIREKVDQIVAECRDTIKRRVMEIWTVRAFYDPSEIIGPDGDLVDSIESLKARGLTVCIDQFQKSLDKEGNEHIEYKLADRDKALEQLKKFLDMGTPLFARPGQSQSDPDSADPDKPADRDIFVVQKVSPEEWASFMASMK